MAEFLMPSLGSDMEAGSLVEWLVQEGDEVKRGDIVAVVETQKGAIEIEIFQTGTVTQLIAQVGDELPVGAAMANIGNDTAADKTTAPTEPDQAAKPKKPVQPVPTIRSADPTQFQPPHTLSPAARRLARDHNLNVDQLQSQIKKDKILSDDVQNIIAQSDPASAYPPPKATDRFSATAMRDAIAAAMTRSNREIPHYFLSHEISLRQAETWLSKQNEDRPPDQRLLMGLLFVRAVAKAALKNPPLNGVYEHDRFQPSEDVHVGLAISLRGGGLVAPAVHDTATLPLEDLMQNMRDLIARARTGRLRSSEINMPTITVSSLGDRGVDTLQGIIFPPQVALVGFGTPCQRPVCHNGKVRSELMVAATLSGDHRVSDGRTGARFLSNINNLLQSPEAL
ncbi:MAG: dihydrolipoamide acetyltransferase family protein [Henriciella sp.]|nr:dihydrolipoamide acetyltransferase family protein [Henriciella sp.]